jgi:hypothetical protein
MHRLTPALVLSLGLLTLPADAQSDCNPVRYHWELTLTRVEALSGEADLQAVAGKLGTQALLRGGVRNPARPRDAARAQLVGSTDGAGLEVTLEKSAP